jgi:hypothetical protein
VGVCVREREREREVRVSSGSTRLRGWGKQFENLH